MSKDYSVCESENKSLGELECAKFNLGREALLPLEPEHGHGISACVIAHTTSVEQRESVIDSEERNVSGEERGREGNLTLLAVAQHRARGHS